MKTVGVRELRQRASEYLRLVENGETLEVTARGRSVALLVPVPRADRRQVLAARRQLATGTGDLLDLGSPLQPARGVPAASELLRRARDDER